MNSQFSSQFHRTCRRSLKGWTTLFIAALSSTLLVITGYASPLPYSEHEHGSDITASGTSLRLPAHDLGIASRYLQLDSRGAVGLKKGLLRIALAINPDWVLLGFAYVEPEQGQQVGDGNSVPLATLKLPGMTLKSTPSAIYLLPRLGLPAQNPNNRYWSCLVYASKKKMNNFRYLMSYEERTQESPPSSSNIVFFEDNNHKGITVMRVPDYPLIKEWGWGLLAECYQSPSNLPVKVRPSWNQWRERIVGLPKDRKLI
ncbi:hypothetical protein DFH05DRAFT_1492788 [Lentinula detonsa]|uniref:Uncharacterized protein n=1 Tax=Lentinula detonsa TaxID=2804962 RepID=A0A9W8NZF9_9AGAR|nr:hypothetical protein DFH05DRAFT_1492788 [Lentinula detonsa]